MDGFPFPVEVIRSARRQKTAHISVNGSGVRVRVPLHVTDAWIHAFVHSKSRLIEDKLQQNTAVVKRPATTYGSGELLSYLGTEYILDVVRAPVENVALVGDQLVVGLEHTEDALWVKHLVVSWYLREAIGLFETKVKQFSPVIGVKPRRLKVRDYKSRWGSCSIHGDLTFNLRLMMAPPEVIDYVVIHELCHMVEHNHSPKFWSAVKTHQPNFEAHQHWLKMHGSDLQF